MTTHSPETPVTGPVRLRRDPTTLVSGSFVALALLFLAAALLVACVLPYGEWDAMSFGAWSREIADNWPHLRFPDASASTYHRPFFYFVQGTVWAIFGFHQALGRVLSLLFSVVLLAATAWIAARTSPGSRRMSASLAVMILLLVGAFAPYVESGLSDIPAAAMVAVTGAALVTPRLGRLRLPAIALAAALAALTKPSTLAALLGLAVAVLIGSRARLGHRTIAAGAIAVGTALGLLYDVVQARYVHLGLRAFLTTGSDGFYAQLADSSRNRVLLDAGWLGSDLRVLLLFALGYSILRLVASHRLAVLAALIASLVWSWLGPHLAGADGVRVGILGMAGWPQQIAVLALALSLLFALAAPAESLPSRLQLARGLVWAAPPFIVWVLRVVYGARLLAPAWPALALLIVSAMLPVFAGALAMRSSFVLVPALSLVVLGAYAVQDINGLGSNGWRQIRAGGLSGLGDAAYMRNIALGGDFSSEINALAPQVEASDRILTYDQRLRFYYGAQVDFAAPQACTQLPGHRLFVLLESDEVRQLYGARAESAYWESCSPKLTMIDERPGAYAIFSNGLPRPTRGGCGAPAPPPGLAVQFGPTYTSEQAAKAALPHVVAVGFVQAHVTQLGCSSYALLETGVPDESVGKSVVDEAATANIDAHVITP